MLKNLSVLAMFFLCYCNINIALSAESGVNETKRESIRKSIIDSDIKNYNEAITQIYLQKKLTNVKLIADINDINKEDLREIEKYTDITLQKVSVDGDFQTQSWLSEWLKRKGMSEEDQCILKWTAAYTAVLAAAAALGWPVIIGTTVSGIVITDTLASALTGVVSGRAAAEIECHR